MDLHFTTSDFNGTIWHAIRHGDGSWTPVGNVSLVVGNPGSCAGLSVAANINQLNLLSHTVGSFGGGQTLWHTTRMSDGSWSPFVNLNNVVGNPGGTIGLQRGAVAMIGTDLHLGVLTSDVWGLNGTIWHAIRSVDGTWTPLGNVNKVVGHPGSFNYVAVAGVAGELHLTGIVGSNIWHAIRHADGTWTPFSNVNAVVGNPGGGFNQVALAGVNGELQLAAIDPNQKTWHAIRHADGTWTPFGDLMGAAGGAGTPLFNLGMAEITDPNTGELALFFVGVADGGVLSSTIRNQAGSWTPIANLNENLGGGPFNYVAVAGTLE
jgi:hypothetical protein